VLDIGDILVISCIENLKIPEADLV